MKIESLDDISSGSRKSLVVTTTLSTLQMLLICFFVLFYFLFLFWVEMISIYIINHH